VISFSPERAVRDDAGMKQKQQQDIAGQEDEHNASNTDIKSFASELIQKYSRKTRRLKGHKDGSNEKPKSSLGQSVSVGIIHEPPSEGMMLFNQMIEKEKA